MRVSSSAIGLIISAVVVAGVFCAMPEPEIREVVTDKKSDEEAKKMALERNYNIGYEYMKNKQFADAISKFSGALDIDSTYAPGYFGLGYTYYLMNEFNKAIENYDLALKYEPDYVAAMKNLAILYMQTGDAEGALGMYRRVMAVNPGEMTEEKKNAMLDLGQLYVNILRDYPNAIGVYEEIVQFDSSNVDGWTNLAMLYNREEITDRELVANKKLFSFFPQNAQYPMNIGNIYTNLQQYDGAVEYYNKALELEPTNVQAHINLGIVYLNQNNYEAAKSAYNKAVAQDANNAKALCGLAEVYVEEGNQAEALRLTKQVLSTNPTEGQAYIVRGKVIEQHADRYSKEKGRLNKLKSDKLYRRAVSEFDKATGDSNWANYARQKIRQLSGAFLSDQEIKEMDFFLNDEQKKEIQEMETVSIERIK